MANGKPKKWSTAVDQAKTDSVKPAFEVYNPAKSAQTTYGSMLGDIGAEQEFASDQKDIFNIGTTPLSDPWKLGDPYYTGLPGAGGGIGTGTLSDAQKMAEAGDPYYGADMSGFQNGLGAGVGLGTSGLTDAQKMSVAGDPYYSILPGSDAQKMAVAGDPYYGIGNGTLDYSKIGPSGIGSGVSGPAGTIQNVSQPAGSLQPEAVAALTETTPPEGLQNESGGAQWSNAFQSLQAQFADPSVAMIDLPVVYNEDGSVVDFYIDQPTTQQVIDPDTGKLTTLKTTQRVLNPKYQALQDYARNAQNQKNFQAQQKQQMDIQQLGMFPQILQMLTTPGVADILGLMGGGGVDPLLQPVFGQGFGLPSSVQGADMPMSDEAAESQLPAMAQPAMQRGPALPTESYLQRIGPSALQGLQGLMGFMGQTPDDLQRMVGSVTPQFSGILPGGGAPAQTTGVR